MHVDLNTVITHGEDGEESSEGSRDTEIFIPNCKLDQHHSSLRPRNYVKTESNETIFRLIAGQRSGTYGGV